MSNVLDTFIIPVTVTRHQLEDIIIVMNGVLENNGHEPNLTIEELIETPELMTFIGELITNESRVLYDPAACDEEGDSFLLLFWQNKRSIVAI